MDGRPGRGCSAPPPNGTAPGRPHDTTRPPWRAALGFVALAFGLSWIPWLTLLVTTGDPFDGPGSVALWVSGGFGPTVAGAIAAAVSRGRGGLRRLGSDLVRWRLGRWYLLLLLPLPVVLVAVGLTVAPGEADWELAAPVHVLVLPVALLGGLLLGGLEEVGWRGYLQPRLQDRVSALTTNVVIGAIWAAWHAPLFLMESTGQSATSPVWFTLHAITLSVIIGWMYNATTGSLLLVVLFHGAVNGWYEWVVGGLAPEAASGFLGPAGVLYALVAAWLVLRHGPMHLAGRPRHRWFPTATSS